MEQKDLEAQALRYNSGKRQWNLVDYKSLEPMIKVLEFGAEKYSPDNWKKGMPKEQLLNSAMRHLVALMDGEEIDSESGLPHIGHLMCNAMFISFFEQGLGSEQAMEYFNGKAKAQLNTEHLIIPPKDYVWITTEQVQRIKNNFQKFFDFQVYNVETKKFKHKSLMLIADWIIIGLLENKLRVCISQNDYDHYFNPKDTKLKYRATT